MIRKIIKVAFATAVVAMAGYGVYTNQKTNIMSDVMLANVEALADSEKGCISKTSKNNGDCTTDGKVYFCENFTIFHDCVKGEYPQ